MAPLELQANGVVSLRDTPVALKNIVKRNASESPLIRLPPEIRNRVAHYVCYSDVGTVFFLLHRKRYIVASSNRLKAVGINSLQTVCKQLRAETKHLELNINNVKVEGALFSLMHRGHDTRLGQCKGTIEIHDVRTSAYELDGHLVSSIFNFAKTNSKTTISVTISNFSFIRLGIQGFMCIGWTIEKAIRGLNKRRFKGYKKAFESWQHGKGIKDLNLKNLRFHPACVVFNKDDFRLRIRTTEQMFVKTKVLPLYGNDENKLMDAVQRWYDEGI